MAIPIHNNRLADTLHKFLPKIINLIMDPCLLYTFPDSSELRSHTE